MEETSALPPEFRDLTYPRPRVNENTLDDNLPAFGSPPLYGAPTVGVGGLDALPLELLHETISQLDLRALTDFRRVNRRAAELVDSLPPYQAIVRHAQNALRGILALGTGRWITCETLYEKLCMSGCEECGDFGGYIYLITCRRLCFLCFTRVRRYYPLLVSQASLMFGLDRSIVETLPCMKTIRGVYAVREVGTPSSVRVDYESALRAGIARHGSMEAMEKYVTDPEIQEALPDRVEEMVRRPHGYHRQDFTNGNPHRFAAVVRVPWLSPTSGEVEWGFHCRGCAEHSELPRHYRRKFLVASFREHLKECGRIQDGEHVVDS